jgi:peptide/nickel transport system permease protein
MSTDLLQALPRSPGVWAQAWTRLKNDRVGMVSLGVTLFFIVLVLLAQLGLVAKDWQKEVGTPFAPPHIVGKIVDGSQTAVIDAIAGPSVDMSDIDPLAPRYEEWKKRAAEFKATITQKSDTLPLGGDQLGRDVLSKVIKGAQVSITVGLTAALFATLIGTILGAIGGYFGGRAGDFLEWVYNVFTAIPTVIDT